MSEKTKIEWTDATWSPLRVRVKEDAPKIATEKGYTSLIQIATTMASRVGQHCEKVSPACEHCYAEAHNRRCLPADGTGLPYDRRSRDLVEAFVDEDMLLVPLKWRKPKRIFVENRSDLFAEWVTDDMLDRVFGVMTLCQRHTFQVLTKRPERMRQYFGQPEVDLATRWGAATAGLRLQRLPGVEPDWFTIPPKNVWLGVTVENQECANKRIPHLLDTPAAVRFVSVEPLLGPVNLHRITGGDWDEDVRTNVLTGEWSTSARDDKPSSGAKLDWVICGGESGHGARPMHPDWARSLRDQCQAAGVPFLFKQWGAFDEHGARVGKKQAGRLLDGREWSEFPVLRDIVGADAPEGGAK